MLEAIDIVMEENEKLHNIIKEAREYIGKTNFVEKGYVNFMYELDKILDKEKDILDLKEKE